MALGEDGGAWVRWAGVGGVACAVTGIAADLFWPQWPLISGLLEGLAVACLVAYAAARFHAMRAAASGRAVRIGLHSGAMILVFLAVIGLLNVLAVRHNVRWDWSESGEFSLSPQSVKILKALDRDVTVTLFVQDIGRTKQVLHGLVDTYRQYTPRFTAVYVDPDKRPAIAKQYGVTQYDTVVFESGGQEARVRLLGPEGLNNREQLFTNALIRVTRTEKKQIAFLEGHGEHRLDDSGQNGFSAVKDGLEREGYAVSGLSLAQRGTVPEQLTALVIGGATKLMAPQEMEAVRNYLNNGGRLLVLADPMVTSGIEPLLADWGVTLDQDLAIETSVTLFGAGPEVVVARAYSTSHTITKDFTLSTAFPAVRSLRFEPAKQAAFAHENLVTTSDKSWGETDLKGSQVGYDQLRDLPGPLVLAMAVQPVPPTKKQPPADAPHLPAGTARLVVFGDSDFAANGFFHLYGNGDLFLNIVNWLAADEEAIAIRPKESRMSPLILDSDQEGLLFWVAVVLLPGAVLFAGLGVWQWRRRL